MTGEAAIIGIVAGLIVAALVVLAVRYGPRRSRDRRNDEVVDAVRGPDGMQDPGRSRPAGPGAEAQAPGVAGGVGAPHEDPDNPR